MNITFLTVAVVGALGVISPGPDFLIITRNSLLYSKRIGLATAFGIATGNLWWITASILGISYLISSMVALFTLIKLLGAAYLVYLGVRSFRSKRKSSTAEISNESPGKREELSSFSAFRIGLLTNVLNPKCALFFVSFFSVLITPKTPLLLQSLYGLEIAIIALLWFSLLATVLSVKAVQKIFDRVAVWVERTTGAILIALGIKVAFYHQK